MREPYGALLLIAYGGPHGLADVRPYLANVLRGRRVPQARVDEVAHHYELFGGRSPLTDLTRRQAAALEAELRRRGHGLSAHVGMLWAVNTNAAQARRAGGTSASASARRSAWASTNPGRSNHGAM